LPNQPLVATFWQSYDAQKERQRPIDSQEQGVVGLAYHTADFGDGDNGDFVDCDLRNLAESIALGRLDFKPELIRVIAKRRRNGQITTEGNSAKSSLCTMSAGRGLP
jgi:hypothetical protein